MPSENPDMVNEEATQDMMRKVFRRSSLTPAYEPGRIKASVMSTILNQMGQRVEERELERFISRLDPLKTGTLDFDAFTKICDRFLTDPAAIARSKGDPFTFKHLISLHDFDHA